MAAATIVLVFNVIKTSINGEVAKGDAWGDGRTIEWAISSPAPEYNFKQTPLVRGLDALWIEKMEGKTELTPAEPIGDIHMPNSSILPVVIASGLFIAALGFMFRNEHGWGDVVGGIGLAITLLGMFLRSWIDDHGYHIHKEELMDDDSKEVKA